MAKNDSMLAILWMLNSGGKITAKQISEKLEINIRTVYRYIDALCASGVPIISDTGHNGGYHLLNSFIKAPLVFDVEEKKALFHAAAFAKEAGYPLSEVLDHAILKLKIHSNQEQEGLLDRHVSELEVINHIEMPFIQPILEQLEWAIENECSIEIDYRTRTEEQPKNRIIDPYGIVYWKNKWYTVAFCHLRNQIRSFRVDRVLRTESTHTKFNRPKAFPTRDFFMKNLLPDLVDREGLVSLNIKGSSEALDELCMHWFLGHHMKERTSNHAVFLFEEKSMHHYVPYILLPYGKSIQIVEPQSLKERLFMIASELMKYYQL